jgi:hypothetical protein
MPTEPLFISTTSASTTYQSNFGRRSPEIREMRLVGFSITGVPVSAGVPDHLFYNLQITCGNTNIMSYNRNDGREDIPLPMTGEFTTYNFSEPMLIFNKNMGIHVTFDKLIFKLTDSNGSTPTFTQLCLWFSVDKD